MKTYLTDANHSITETDTAVILGNNLSVTLQPRSLTTLVLPPATVPGSVQLFLTPTMAKLGDGSFQAAVTVTNNGMGTAQGVTLTGATLGSTPGVPAPISALPQTVGLGAIAPGGYALIPLNFASGAALSGSMTIQRYSGTYAGGTFAGSFRTVLP